MLQYARSIVLSYPASPQAVGESAARGLGCWGWILQGTGVHLQKLLVVLKERGQVFPEQRRTLTGEISFHQVRHYQLRQLLGTLNCWTTIPWLTPEERQNLDVIFAVHLGNDTPTNLL